MGDYGAFWYQVALAGSYYADGDHQQFLSSDDGTAILTALTKCDRYSWCSGLQQDNLTTTRESWHDGTYSHGWGTSPVVGVSLGVMGVKQTSPGFATFTVMPKLGTLTHAYIKVPTLRGFITVNATPASVLVRVPCNTLATLCLPRSSSSSSPLEYSKDQTSGKLVLLLDGVNNDNWQEVSGHICLSRPVGCGVAGQPRALQFIVNKI
mmetsp:Transcript_3048/g.5756  ORF Transcript_3048/g.5756 Transcript_3048/m.5756 type:complete len:208 (+) Transcript_3048:57-680(+)